MKSEAQNNLHNNCSNCVIVAVYLWHIKHFHFIHGMCLTLCVNIRQLPVFKIMKQKQFSSCILVNIVCFFQLQFSFCNLLAHLGHTCFVLSLPVLPIGTIFFITDLCLVVLHIHNTNHTECNAHHYWNRQPTFSRPLSCW